MNKLIPGTVLQRFRGVVRQLEIRKELSMPEVSNGTKVSSAY